VLEDGEPGDELAIISGASFVVSTTTGGDCLALAYRRPVLYVDSARFYLVFLATELATFQLPRMEDSQNGDILSLNQILERGLGWVAEQQSFTDANVTVVRSTPEEIRDYVAEYCSSETWKRVDALDANEDNWRDLLLSHHRSEILKRHGPIRARMHPASKNVLLPSA
jgi:putative glycosyltransferase (TIGR04372 family)